MLRAHRRPRPLALLLAAFTLAGCAGDEEPTPLSLVGGAVCAGCHAKEAEAWRGSHHDLAMQLPGPGSVRGDFGNVAVEHDGTTTRFRRAGDRYVVTTVGPDGTVGDFEVAYTFGVEPLQQVLLRLPGGRLQAFTVAWDARPAGEGGERWFSLYPNETLVPGDPLHWTGIQHNWNHMCADCHSTGLRKNWNAEQERYETTWTDLDVACEACHGAGSQHAAAPATPMPVPLSRAGRRWERGPETAIAHLAAGDRSAAEIETCGRCHARRATLREKPASGAPLLETHRVARLDAGLYFDDGQIRDEVYVYGSFRQSAMAAAGVLCSDCHEPHGLGLRAEGNALCAQCHAPEVFDERSHHHHAEGTAGSACIDCHMPERTYMRVDVRHDHSFRVPRPDLSVRLGTPNACGACHEQGAAWAAAALANWYPEGRSGTPHFGEAFAAGRRGEPGAAASLVAIAGDPAQPALVRATALDLLLEAGAPGAVQALRSSARDGDPILRSAAAEGAGRLPGPRALEVARPLLSDPVAAVRMAAAETLAGVPDSALAPAEREARRRGVEELEAALARDADRPEGRFHRGLLDARRGRLDEAAAWYDAALELEPAFTPAVVNRADLARATGDEAHGEAVLRRALERAPDDPDLHHALGLSLVRTGGKRLALEHLGRAARLAPERVHFAYVHAVALRDAGQTEQARRVAAIATERNPGHRGLEALLRELERDRGAR